MDSFVGEIDWKKQIINSYKSIKPALGQPLQVMPEIQLLPYVGNLITHLNMKKWMTSWIGCCLFSTICCSIIEVDQKKLLMEEILHHPTCMKPCK